MSFRVCREPNGMNKCNGIEFKYLGRDSLGKFYGQAERAISMGQLRVLLRFHLPPIKVVVFDRSS
jgi:hypothetical protein